MELKYPSSKKEVESAASALNTLMGGRKDVISRYYDFKDELGERVHGWAPWKGRLVKQDYKPKPGELVLDTQNYKEGILEWRVMRPLTNANLAQHVEGKERLGVFVLDADEKVTLLAADFDDHDGSLAPEAVYAEAKHFYDIAETHEFWPHMERSHSGLGYHVWVFFDTPVPAGDVRAVGKWLLEESEVLREGEDFEVFDRFFPAQSKVPSVGRGFGNAIALPLAGKWNYNRGRCAWMHADAQQIVADPLAYTEAIIERRRVPSSLVGQFMKEQGLTVEESTAPSEGRIHGEDILAGVDEPGRDEKLFKYACQLRSRGVSITEAHAIIGVAASKCNPPFGSDEAEKKVNSAYKYSDEKGKRKSRSREVKFSVEPWDNSKPVPWSEDVPLHPETGWPWPPEEASFKTAPNGVFYGDQLIVRRPMWVQSLVMLGDDVVALEIKFFDHKYRLCRHSLRLDVLNATTGVLGQMLQTIGCMCIPGKEKWVSRLLVLQYGNCRRYIRCATFLGWHKDLNNQTVFVLPSLVIGAPEEEIIYTGDVPKEYMRSMKPKDTLEKWQQEVARRCLGNPFLMFSAMVALSGPLMQLLNEPGGGFHLFGSTSIGKTTCGQVAASVWGSGASPSEDSARSSVRKWDLTLSSIEGIAELHSNQVLVLDEVMQTDLGQNLGGAIYKIAEGKGKDRASFTGGLTTFRSWRAMILSNGELSLKQFVNQSPGRAYKGGQGVRILDIPTDGNDERGAIVVESHGAAPKSFVEDLRFKCGQHYGIAGPVFVSFLVHKLRGDKGFVKGLDAELKVCETKILKRLNTEVSREGKRALRKFALVFLAGLYSGKDYGAGVLEWTMEACFDAVFEVSKYWLDELGDEISELDRGLAHFRHKLVSQASRFRHFDAEETPTQRDILGFRTDGHFLILPRSMLELVGDYNPRIILMALRQNGFLWSQSPDRYTRPSPRLKGYPKTRLHVYWVSVEFLGETVGREDVTEEDKEVVEMERPGELVLVPSVDSPPMPF